MSTRVADTPNYNASMRNIMRTQDQMSKNLAEMSTGYKVDTFSGIAAETPTFLNLRAQSIVSEGFGEELERVDGRMGFVEAHVRKISEHISISRVRLTAALNPTQTDTGLQTYAAEELNFLQTTLNMKDAQGLMLFGGTRTDTNPCDMSLLGPPGLAPSYAYAADSGASRTVSTGSEKEVAYDILARSPAFAEYIYSLQLMRDNPPSPDPESQNYLNLKNALGHLKTADIKTAELIDTVGTTRKNIEDMQELYQSDQKHLDEMSTEMISSDPAATIIKMMQLNLQLGLSLKATRDVISNQQALNILGG
ncbi:MAG: hypothetical protein K2X98_02385 [Alphaproteobacteria bacterium]|nr:hypothetical protein [Alphaproteobacteria bacterium]MBX9977081.1 hypothetical protein [Alphaproteobacteria bacterium]